MASDEEVKATGAQIEEIANRLAAPYEEIAMLARRLQSVSGGDSGGGSFNPINDIAWEVAFWAEDPNWTPPADGSAVSQWDDGVGTNHAVQATGSKQPTYRASTTAFNSKPTIEWGSGDALQTGAFGSLITGPSHVFTVAQATSVTTLAYMHIFDGITSGNRRVIYHSNSANNFKLYAGNDAISYGQNTNLHAWLAYFDGSTGNDTLKVDETLEINANAGANDWDGLTIGNDYDEGIYSFIGHIAFIGVLDGTLTAGEEADLWAWAQSHYGTP